MTLRIYLDNNATTPVLPQVLEAILPYLSTKIGNPSSAHHFGIEAQRTVDAARDDVGALLGCASDEIIFTSSATEAINTALYSATKRGRARGRIVTTAVEHSAVLSYCTALEEDGFDIVRVGVDRAGVLNVDELRESITAETRLVSVMWANNETGVIFPIGDISELCREKGVLLHVDAVQAAGKLSIAFDDLAIDYLSVSAHKIFGPKGVGALIARNGAPFHPLHQGGHQESGRRGGTENVAGIVGFGVAARLAKNELESRAARIHNLRSHFEDGLGRLFPDACIHGITAPRVPNTTNIGFPGIDGDTLVAALDIEGVCVSAGSACMADSIAPSHVIMAMTHSYAAASEAVRFSLSHLNTERDVTQTLEVLSRVLPRIRQAETGSA